MTPTPDADETLSDSSADDSYHGTRGWADGNDASREAAFADLTKGVTNKTQRLVLILAQQAGRRGVTVGEVREAKGALHHGRMSSALTKQHIAGKLVALRERRGNQGVYVLPEFVDGRDVRPYRPQRKTPDTEVIVGVLLHHEYMTPTHSDPYCRCGEWVAPHTGPITPAHRQHLAEMIAEALS